MQDRYDEKGVLGEGGASTVVEVFDRLLERSTAHKVLKPGLVARPAHRERFMDEARLTGQLTHPGIVPIHTAGETHSGEPFIEMKLVRGDTLEHLVENAGDRLDPDTLSRFLQVLLKVCDALAFAHSHGVVHRDLKPANIMVGAFGEVYLMDWGIAGRLDDGPIHDEDLVGTPAFMAPEQVKATGTDERTDIFALGATLYFCVTGRSPYSGPGAIQTLAQAYAARWTPLEEVLGDAVPPGIDVIIARAMQADPNERYPTIQAMQRDLENWLRGRWHLPARTYAPDQVIVREGDEGDEAFVIVSGSCTVSTVIDGRPRVLATLGPGDVFGEIAIFSDVRRTSTVTASGPVEVQVVTRKTLTAATGLDSWVGRFITALANRFVSAEARLHGSKDSHAPTNDDPHEG